MNKKVEFLQSRYYVGIGDRSPGDQEELNIAMANGLIAAGLAKEVIQKKQQKDKEE